MLSINLTRHENDLLAQILAMPNITLRILRTAMYHLRKKNGLCITIGCSRQASNGVRCEHCQSLNRKHVSTYNKKEQQ